MTCRLITELAARREWSGSMLVVREDRDLKPDFQIIGLRALAVVLVSLPLWRSGVLFVQDIPYLLALLVAAGSLWQAQRMATDLKAARNSTSWRLAVSPDRVWINMRSYRHYHWPRTDKTVFAFDRADIDQFHAVRFRSGALPELAICLEQPLIRDHVVALIEENCRMEQGRFGYTRAAHEPVRLEKNLRIVRLQVDNCRPNLSQTLDKLRLSWPVEATRASGFPEDNLLPNDPELDIAA